MFKLNYIVSVTATTHQEKGIASILRVLLKAMKKQYRSPTGPNKFKSSTIISPQEKSGKRILNKGQ